MHWRPLSVRSDPDSIAEYDVLHDGVPQWLIAGAISFVNKVLRYGDDSYERLRLVEQLLRIPLDWNHDPFATLLNEVGNDGSRALDIIDVCVMLTQTQPGGHRLRENLDLALQLGGSAWQVVSPDEGTPALERRVDATVERAARQEIARGGNAARHLALAWRKTYGRDTDASGAFREAVRAVEAAAKPVVTPRDRATTLGKMIIAMRDKPAKWTSDLGNVEKVVGMMSELWTSQLDRHGTDDESVRLSVSPEEAEAAVHLAVLLVHWFRTGHVRAA